MFVHGYPELVEKNQVSTQTLLTVTEKRGMDAIKEHLQVDELYALQLSALVDACIPIMRRKLKDDACTNVDGYFCLGHKDFAKAKKLMEKLVYIYMMKFDVSNNATPIRNRPYQGELLILLISNQLFHSLRAIGVKFASHFVEIAKNKLKHPKIPIPLLTLVATAVLYLSLLCLFRSFVEVAWFTREVQLLGKPIQQSLQLPCQLSTSFQCTLQLEAQEWSPAFDQV
ncbi:uncharacterized protein F5891DRAFT_977101 [Suillus fuscotomentosus]|uniref:DUF6532 domain-containing protein n=1 Tax=Suillus fuscotomentosus TaxID=1912939 RepID=A0AAD4EDW7_9AGAM|nr:uncharacterized protein F5891DRAFT_977101 [Suillus fuscotomentosus]KAG1904217.1 hypothetical protein F5891DRAFT_977101 [Suillus fuscotomentosus]